MGWNRKFESRHHQNLIYFDRSELAERPLLPRQISLERRRARA
jgi:hypothetical protein